MLKKSGGLIVAGLALVALSGVPAVADTLTDALVSTYLNNPTLNTARATLRGTDEGVPQALALWRPSVNLSANVTGTFSESFTPGTGANAGFRSASFASEGLTVTLTQPIFRGFRTVNSVKRAESTVLLGRETLRNTEQNVLLQAVQAYMNVVRDQAILGFTQQNLDFLAAQVKAAEDRLRVGEGTRTDVAQANASQAAAIFSFNTAKANLATSMAVYEQVIGRKPRNLMAAAPIDRLLPNSSVAAVAKAVAQHPAIHAAKLNVDVANYNVKAIEGELLPTINLNGSVSRSQGGANGPDAWSNTATIGGSLTMPLYDGGSIASRVRQAKEQVDQMRISVDTSIDSIKALTATDFALVDASKAQLASAQAAINANQLALEGVMEERNVGQRTTLDVLNAQAGLLNARISFAQATTNRVVNTYTLLSAVGGLTAEGLRLPVKIYKPEEHYSAVRNNIGGLRTPDGR